MTCNQLTTTQQTMTPESLRLRGRSRSGVTVIEVLFATGIVIFGLVGIASLLAVAGRNSTVANESAESQFYATSWQQEFLVRGMNQVSNWVWWGADGATTTTETAVPASTGREAVCIDPLFYIRGPFGTNPGRFPYPSTTSPIPRASLWDTNINPNLELLATSLFSSNDDLAMEVSEEDRTLPATRFSVGTDRFLSTGEYTWLATMCPREHLVSGNPPTLEDYYTLSVVVCHRRDLEAEADFAVTATAPFRYGAGGTVTVIDAGSTIRAGHWVMLYQQQATTPPQTICRWYRVLSATDPNASNERTLQLDGPDWTFSGSDRLVAVSGAVQVVERMIRVER